MKRFLPPTAALVLGLVIGLAGTDFILPADAQVVRAPAPQRSPIGCAPRCPVDSFWANACPPSTCPAPDLCALSVAEGGVIVKQGPITGWTKTSRYWTESSISAVALGPGTPGEICQINGFHVACPAGLSTVSDRLTATNCYNDGFNGCIVQWATSYNQLLCAPGGCRLRYWVRHPAGVYPGGVQGAQWVEYAALQPYGGYSGNCTESDIMGHAAEWQRCTFKDPGPTLPAPSTSVIGIALSGGGFIFPDENIFVSGVVIDRQQADGGFCP